VPEYAFHVTLILNEFIILYRNWYKSYCVSRYPNLVHVNVVESVTIQIERNIFKVWDLITICVVL